jgi:DNA-binding transcriptional MerR regulator
VDDDDLLTIGLFAVLSGLSINALRHYDELGLLAPVQVDPATGYRRYHPRQVGQARMICALRRVDMPIEAVQQVLLAPGDAAVRDVLTKHRNRLAHRARALNRLIRVVDHYIAEGVTMPELKTPRLVQVVINVTDLPASIQFYETAFDASFNEDISSFVFGVWPSDEFFLLTLASAAGPHGETHGPTGTSRFSLLVADVDEAHQRALDAGAGEISKPTDFAWKPRSSVVTDPSGNVIGLSQA